MIVDANLLLYAVDETSAFNQAASVWWTTMLNGDVAVGVPWQTIGAFVRIGTHPRIMTTPMSSDEAWNHVESWLTADPAWIPPATDRTARIYADLIRRRPVTGNLVPDAMLAAQAIELGVEIVSADSDFALFPDVRWTNPLR